MDALALRQAFLDELEKISFQTSQYSTPIEGARIARQPSLIPAFVTQDLRESPIKKKS